MVSSLDEIADRLRDASGADFTFVLTRRGRLVTQNAPRDMPEGGRRECVRAGVDVEARGEVAQLALPREVVVPYGGAAPVDIYVTAHAEAIVCVVMATWADKTPVLPAIETALDELERALEKVRSPRRRTTRRKITRTRAEDGSPPSPVAETTAEPAALSPGPPPLPEVVVAAPPAPADPASWFDDSPTARYPSGVRPLPLPSKSKSTPPGPPPSKKSAMAGLVRLAGTSVSAAGSMKSPPQISKTTSSIPPALPKVALASKTPRISMPELTIGMATVGRETLAAITEDANQNNARFSKRQLHNSSMAEITIRTTVPGHDTLTAIHLDAEAEVSIGEGVLGRDSLEAVNATSDVPLGNSGSPTPELRVTLASLPHLGPESRRVGSDRMTQPWTEVAEDAKRAIDAQQRSIQPIEEAETEESGAVPNFLESRASTPRVVVKLQSFDEDTIAAVIAERAAQRAAAPKRPVTTDKEEIAKRRESLDAWHEAIDGLIEPSAKGPPPLPGARPLPEAPPPLPGTNAGDESGAPPAGGSKASATSAARRPRKPASR